MDQLAVADGHIQQRLRGGAALDVDGVGVLLQVFAGTVAVEHQLLVGYLVGHFIFSAGHNHEVGKVIVTAALTGAVTTKQDNPYLPTQPKEIAEAALRCYEAGAAMVHIHVRDDNDAGSMRFDKFEEAVGLIRATGCPVLLNLTSSGGQGFSWEERIRPFRELRPEMASFDAGTMNWLHSVVFMNEPKFLELCGQEMRAAGVKPEIEVFDMGMLNTAKHYLKTGVLDAPAHFQLCLGAPGGMEATTESLVYLVNHLPENCTWSTFGIGRGANEITLAALAMGGNIRVGLEDNVYYNKGVFGCVR